PSADRRDGALAGVARLLQGADRDLSRGLAPLLGNAVLDLQHEGAATRAAAPRAAGRGGPLAAAAAGSPGVRSVKRHYEVPGRWRRSSEIGDLAPRSAVLQT